MTTGKITVLYIFNFKVPEQVKIHE